MNFLSAFKYSVIAAVVSIFCSTTVGAAQISNDRLKKVEQEVFEQSMEHKKLQAQATQIALEINEVNRKMIKTAKQLQNNEEKLSQMENQLKILKKDLFETQNSFDKEDNNLIKTLTALQNLALKPTEALLVQPLNPVDIIRSAMILRETVPYLEMRAEHVRKKLIEIENKKNRIEQQITEISKQKIVMNEEHKRINSLIKQKSSLRNLVEIKSEKAKKNVDKLASKAQDLRELLTKDGDTTKWQALGIDFEDIPFEEYMNKILFKDKKGE
jgi:septal ring factor EnvC (AmiA/AmiB activator)